MSSVVFILSVITWGLFMWSIFHICNKECILTKFPLLESQPVSSRRVEILVLLLWPVIHLAVLLCSLWAAVNRLLPAPPPLINDVDHFDIMRPSASSLLLSLGSILSSCFRLPNCLLMAGKIASFPFSRWAFQPIFFCRLVPSILMCWLSLMISSSPLELVILQTSQAPQDQAPHDHDHDQWFQVPLWSW